MLNVRLALATPDSTQVGTDLCCLPLGSRLRLLPVAGNEPPAAVYVPILQTICGLSCNSMTLALAATVATVGGAVLAALELSTPPPEPDCSPFQPGRSERDSLTCLQQAIVSQQPETLLPALDLVGHWPLHHPLFNEGQGLLEHWTQTLLQQAADYQAQGRLPEAIALVKPIPPTSPHFTAAQTLLHELSQAQQQQATMLYTAAHTALQRQAWAEVFQSLWQLQDLEQASLQPGLAPLLARQLEAERQAQKQLNQARQRHALGTPATHVEAIALASQIDRATYVWRTAQPLLNTWCDEVFPIARQRFEQGDTAEAIAVVQTIAENPHRRIMAQDWLILAQARQLAQLSLAPEMPTQWAPVGLAPALLTTHGLQPSSPWQAPAIVQRQRWSQYLTMTTAAWGPPMPGPTPPALQQTQEPTIAGAARLTLPALSPQVLTPLWPEKRYQPTLGLRGSGGVGRHLRPHRSQVAGEIGRKDFVD